MRAFVRNRLLLVCLLLSGFAGLAYELMWTRLLSFSFGSTTLSFSTVLAVFFAGLALGAYFAGKRSPQLEHPIRTYAKVELGCGAAGFVLYFVLEHLGGIFASFDPGPNLFGLFVRFIVAAPLLLIPTLLMGATLPIVCRAVIEKDDEIGRGSALIYGLNTLGACLGAYLVTYHLLPALGVFATNALAVAANVLAGAGALLIERSGGTAPVPASAQTEASRDTPSRELRKWIAVAAVLTGLGGFAAISMQVVWVRVFSTILDGTIYGIGAVLISVLIGIALGSIFIARTLKSARYPVFWFVALQLAMMLSILWFCSNLSFIEYVLRFFATSKATPLRNLHAQLLGTFLVLLVPTFASGASLPLLLQMIERRPENSGRTLGVLYAANTAGSILGSLLTGFITVPEAGSEATVFITLLAIAASAAIAAALLGGRELRVLRLALAGAAIFALAKYDGIDIRGLGKVRPNIPVTYERWEEAGEEDAKNMLFFAEGEHATVVVRETGHSRQLALNGLAQGSLQNAPPHYLIESVLVAYVPFVHARALDRAMVVGLGAGATMDLLAQLGVKKVRVLELEARVADAVRVIYAPEDPLKSPNVELLFNDARHQLLLEKKDGGGRYDIIASMPAHPWVASSVFTREFFELARDNLGDGGVFCTWFGLGKMDDPAIQSLLRAFVEVFPNYVVYRIESAGAYYLVGAKSGLTLNLDRIAALQTHPLIRGQTFFKNPRALALTTYASGTPETPGPPPGPVNTDDSAFVETHAPLATVASTSFNNFLPREYLSPEMIPENARAEFYDPLLEDLFAAGKQAGAERTFEAVKNILPPAAQSYFAGRIALAHGKKDEAFSLLGEAHAPRAEKIKALALPPGSPEQLAALDALPKTTDVLIAMLEHSRARALAKLDDAGDAIAPPDPKEDPARWLMYAAEKNVRNDAAFLTHVGPMLKDTNSRALLALAVEYADGAGLVEEAKLARAHIDALDRRRASELVRAGTRAGAAGNFAAAAELLARAAKLAPSDDKTHQLLVRALVELGDREALDAELSHLRFHGFSEEYLEWLVRDARSAQKSAEDMVEESDGDRPPN